MQKDEGLRQAVELLLFAKQNGHGEVRVAVADGKVAASDINLKYRPGVRVRLALAAS